MGNAISAVVLATLTVYHDCQLDTSSVKTYVLPLSI